MGTSALREEAAPRPAPREQARRGGMEEGISSRNSTAQALVPCEGQGRTNWREQLDDLAATVPADEVAEFGLAVAQIMARRVRRAERRTELTADILVALNRNPSGLTSRGVRRSVRGRNDDIDAILKWLKGRGYVTSESTRGGRIWRAQGANTAPGTKGGGRPRPGAGHVTHASDDDPDSVGAVT